MYYKLYHNVFDSPPPEERRTLFDKFYKEHGVELVGVFRNRENPLEFYMITAYRDMEHYQEFINIVQEDPEYVAMTKRVSEVRRFSESITLEKV